MIYNFAIDSVLRQDREKNRLREVFDPLHSLSVRVALGLEPRYRDFGLSYPSTELACAFADPFMVHQKLHPNRTSDFMVETERHFRQTELADSLLSTQALKAIRSTARPVADYLRPNDDLARMAAGDPYFECLRQSSAVVGYGDIANAWRTGDPWQPPSHSLLGNLDDARLAAINASIQPWRQWPGYTESFSALATASDAMSAIGGIDSYRPLIGDIHRLSLGPKFETSPQARVRTYLDAGFNPTLLKPNQKALIGMLGLNGFIDPRLWEYDGKIIIPARRARMQERLDALKPTRLQVKAYREIGAFECWLRAFIDEEMSLEYGGDWFATRIPKNLLNRVQRNMLDGTEISGGVVLNDADFAHYREIILNDDHWADVFSYIFEDRTVTEDMLNLLKSLRTAIAHFKGTTKADLVQLRVCVRWFRERVSGFDE